MYASYHNHPEVAQALIDAGCELDAVGSVSIMLPQGTKIPLARSQLRVKSRKDE